LSLDPPRLRRVPGYLQLVADPEGADRHTEQRHQRRGLWLAPTFEGMVAVDGLLEPEAGQTLVSALEPLARRPALRTPVVGASDAPTRLLSWPAAPWKPDSSPRAVGSGPS
jgi:hypothetical protein